MNKKLSHYIGTFFVGIVSLAGGVSLVRKSKEVHQERQLVIKNDKIIQMLDQFLTIKQSGLCLECYFKENGFKSVAIYGMGYLGKRLFDELKNTEIKVTYAIDKKISNIDCDVEVLTLDKTLPSVDVVIVTPVFYFLEIEKELDSYVNCPIISLEDVLDEVQLSGL